ncbi:hypothetical protein UFOVP54_26 [uncultured Caudovirales phage]|uniref:Uncharacterized protein n=1 Tax=uncultured Caudovirales phage TaxID=2100421 RepID=A0A6J5KUG3_9CAUD|nr:hypothetical protein UFOVP54_26 [uncultured Caudovirales phage]
MEADAKSGNKKDEKLDYASTDTIKEILRKKAESLGDAPHYTTKARK